MARSAALVLAALAALGSGLAAPAAEREPIRGVARVLDGDTLAIGAHTIRLHGVDAPERDQTCAGAGGIDWPCGEVAATTLKAWTAAGEVICAARTRDAYGRLIGACAPAADPDRDFGRRLVADGLAWAYLHFSDVYAEVETEARAASLGIWQSPTMTAWDYRAGGWEAATGTLDPAAAPQAAAAPPPTAGADGCTIKGNISAAGERVFHSPGTRWYGRTRINEGAGEKWFCTATAAQSEGWRPAAGSN